MRWTNVIVPHMDEFHPSSKPYGFSGSWLVLCVCVCVCVCFCCCCWKFCCCMLSHDCCPWWVVELPSAFFFFFFFFLPLANPFSFSHLFSVQKSSLDSLAKTSKFVSFSVVFERERGERGERERSGRRKERDRDRNT